MMSMVPLCLLMYSLSVLHADQLNKVQRTRILQRIQRQERLATPADRSAQQSLRVMMMLE